MSTLSEWFTRNPVAANLLALLVIVGGMFTAMGIRIEGFPRIPPSWIAIDIVHSQSSAQQVDRGISKKVEKALEGLSGVKKVVSLSYEGNSRVLVQKESGYDMGRLLSNVKTRVEGIDNLPKKSERPVINVDEYKDFVLLVQIYADEGGEPVDEKTLQQSAGLLKQELQANPRISKIDVFGKKEKELRIELDADRLAAFGISIDQVAATVSENRTETGFGRLKNDGGNITIRSDITLEYLDQLTPIPLLTREDGSKVYLKDVATLVEGYEESDAKAFFQGQESVGMVLYTGSKGHMIQVSEAAHQVVAQVKRQLPETVHIDIWGDYSTYMKDRLALLQSNAWQGLLIVFGILALFLNVKLAFWVAMGIPFSIAGCMALMGESFLDTSLNDITTFGMIIVLGILVDDAVVVGESVFEQRQSDGDCDPVVSTVKGVHKVATATIFGVLTSIAAFYPLMLINSDFGKILAGFSMVVCVALLFSLIESKLVLPAHLAGISIRSRSNTIDNLPQNPVMRMLFQIQRVSAGALQFVNERLYTPLLKSALHHRYTVLVIFIFLAFIGLWFIRMGIIRTVFFPDIPGDVICVSVTMKQGAPPKMSEKNAAVIEKGAADLNRKLTAMHKTEYPPIRKIMSSINGEGNIEIYAELQPQDLRVVETATLLKMWRKNAQGLEGVESIQFSGNAETGGGFLLKVTSRNEASLAPAVRRIKSALHHLSGVHDIRDDLKPGGSELRLTLKEAARHLGMTPTDLATQVGVAYGGYDIDKFQKGDNEVTLKLIYGKARRRYIHQLLDTNITLKDGSSVPLSMVATVESKRASGYIHRVNGKRVVEVKAALDKNLVSAGNVFRTLQKTVIPEIQHTYPDVEISAGGELEEEQSVKDGLVKALIMIALLIYALLAVPLKSYWKPMVIMSVIPFGFVGAALGHLIADVPLSVLSFFGMLALAGIVVNDSLVMLTRFNDILAEGTSVQDALREAGSSRFRAIFLTTATTVCGLLPLIMETSEQAQYLIPAAISLAYGELFATGITLLLIPILMHIAYDIQRISKRIQRGTPAAQPRSSNSISSLEIEM